MNKFKVFISNIVIYGFGGIISRIVPLIMLPIVTRIMPDSSFYGLNDLSVSLVSAGQAVAVFGMYDAMFRLFFDKEDQEFQKQICSTALFLTLVTTAAVFLLMIVFHDTIARAVFQNEKYAYLVYLAAFAVLAGATNNIAAAPTKIQNESKVFLIVNTLSPVISYLCAVPLLLQGFYTSALQMAHLAAAVLTEGYFLYRNRKWFSFHSINKQYVKPLLKIAVPLMPGFLIYWIYNSSDRIMIQYFLNAHETGIYAISAKSGQISSLIYTAFTGGWLYFSYSTMKEERQAENNSKIFEYLGIISFAVSIMVCGCSYIIFQIVFTDEYLPGFQAAPYLFLAPLLQMLFQIASNQFIIMKKSWPGVLILSCGAVFNIGCNLLLIPALGIEGAAIGTLCGYASADILCVLVLIKIKKMTVSSRFLLSTVITAVFFIVWGVFLYRFTVWGLVISVMTDMILCLLYLDDIKHLIVIFRNMMKERRD